jgi:hypothetical protein
MPYGLDYRLDIEDEMYVDKLISNQKDTRRSSYNLPFLRSSKVISSVGGKAKQRKAIINNNK